MDGWRERERRKEREQHRETASETHRRERKSNNDKESVRVEHKRILMPNINVKERTL